MPKMSEELTQKLLRSSTSSPGRSSLAARKRKQTMQSSCACLRETPVKYSICLRGEGMMMSHGCKPVEITSAEEEEESDEDETEVDDGVEIKQEPTAEEENDYKDAVDQGEQEADAAGR